MQTSTVWADVDGSAEMNYDLGPNLPLPKLASLKEEEDAQTNETLDPAAKAFLSKIPNHGPPYKVMLVGLPQSLTKSDLNSFLSEHQIPHTKLDYTPEHGYCFMTFSSRNACALCVNLKNQRIQGKLLSMKLSGSAQQAELRKRNCGTATGVKGGDQRFKSLRQGDNLRNKPRRPNLKHNAPVGGSIRKSRGPTKKAARAPVHQAPPRTNPWEKSRQNDCSEEKVTIMSRGNKPIQSNSNVSSSNSRFGRNDETSSPRRGRRDDVRRGTGDFRQGGSDFRRNTDRNDRDTMRDTDFRATDFKRNDEGRAETSMSWRRGPAARAETRTYSRTSQPPKPSKNPTKDTPPQSQRNNNRNPFEVLDQD